LRGHTLAAALVGNRRVGEAVADDPGAARQRRLDDFLHVVEARREHEQGFDQDRKSTRLNSSHVAISYAVFCLKKKKKKKMNRKAYKLVHLVASQDTSVIIAAPLHINVIMLLENIYKTASKIRIDEILRERIII